MSNFPEKFIPFKGNVDGITLPNRFTFPFYYQPHPIAILAAEELQNYIQAQVDWNHNFGLDPAMDGPKVGKMFGVLVVQSPSGELGYLAAFSGKLADKNDYDFFVPPVFDMLIADGFYRKGERQLYQMSDVIHALEASEELKDLKAQVVEVDQMCTAEMQALKATIKETKAQRSEQRLAAADWEETKREQLFLELNKQSVTQQFALKDLIKKHRAMREEAQQNLDEFQQNIQQLKHERKATSIKIQNQIFDQYDFLNAFGETKNVLQLFEHVENGRPPSGAGECCAPKLLQYAYQNALKPVALAEFWWGESPASEIRKHQFYYPACRGKCEPILGYMLQGLEMDPNPLLINPAEGRDLEIIFEDEAIVVVNKPADFLSVPGKTITDSVLTRMQAYLPNSTGPLLVHRLDMSTSGILLVGKTKEAHDYLQYQFIKRFVKKRYVALLDGRVTADRGVVDLPLRVDLDDRPRQLVCYEHGKNAVTEWELIEYRGDKSLVYFYPVTGRTHQLRVHAAHSKGLGMPITGDDLYGEINTRLHLHAEQITFRHPVSKEMVTFNAILPF